MRPRELPADLDDLCRGLSLRENDFGKPDSPHPVEVQREVLRHGPRSYPEP